MKKLNEEEKQWIRENSIEILSTLFQINKELKSREEELLLIPTKEERIKKVLEISKKYTEGS